MFHMELFSSSIATGANTFAQLNYVSADAILPKLNNGVQVSPTLNMLHSVMGVGTNLVHVRAQANSMLPFPYNAISPNNRGGAFESPPRIWDMSHWPLGLRPTEEFDIFATQNAAGAQTEYVAVQFTDGQLTMPAVAVNPPGLTANSYIPGRFLTVHATSATTLTAGAWTQCLLTFDQSLPAGYYALMGARAFSATALFFRMFPAMAPLWRPGGVAVQAYDQMDPMNQRYMNAFNDMPRGWGVWLYFYQNVPPAVEMFATSADTAEEFWLDLVWIGQQVTPGL